MWPTLSRNSTTARQICQCPALDKKITAILRDVTQNLESSSTHDLWD